MHLQTTEAWKRLFCPCGQLQLWNVVPIFDICPIACNNIFLTSPLKSQARKVGARPTVGAAFLFSFALQASVWCHNTCMLFTSSPHCIQPGSHEITKCRVEINKKSIVSLPFTIFSAALKENFVLVEPTVEPKNMYSNGLVVHVWGAAALLHSLWPLQKLAWI